jgi:hypothetical protein
MNHSTVNFPATTKEQPPMFALPSMWNLIISTIVFFFAVWYFRRYLDDQGIPGGATRGVLVFTLAFLVSWGAGKTVDWVQEQIGGKQSAAQSSDIPLQQLKDAGEERP